MKNVQEVLPYLNLVAERRDEAQREEYLKSKGIPTDDNLIIEDLFGNTIFGSKHRAMPNDFARSCLFTARNHRVPRKTFSREKLFHISEKVEILYTGTELRSVDDELIWMQLVDYCRRFPLG
ncbi:plasmid replication initiator TrfA, partial [Neisseria gonorrhoeae]